MKHAPIVAIDFDMTISNNRDWLNLNNPPMAGAVDVIRELKKMGCILILWTCRDETGTGNIQLAKDYLAKYGILDCFSFFNDNTDDLKAEFHNNSRKIYADIYIDDKNLGGFPGWHNVLHHVMDLIHLKGRE